MANVSEISKLHKDGQYFSFKGTETLIDELTALGMLDKKSEDNISKAKKAQSTGCIMGIAGAVIVVITLMIATEFGGGGGTGFFVFIGFMVGLFGLIFYNIKKGEIRQFSKDEFPDYRYQTCLSLLSLLQTDIATNAILDLSVNLKPHPFITPDEPNQKDKTKKPKGERMWKTTFEPIINLKGRFKDGTKFDYELTEHLGAYGEWFYYRAISGKTKTKLRARKRTRWSGKLRLRFKDKRYNLDSMSLEAIEGMVQIPQGARFKKIKQGDSEITLTAVTDTIKQKHKAKLTQNIIAAWEGMLLEDEKKISNELGHLSAMMFLSLYQVMNANQENKAKKS